MDKTNKILGVMQQIRRASANPAAFTVGSILGAVVPVLSFWACHFEFDSANPWSITLVIILGALMVSAVSVWQWTKTAFRSAFKATGFVLLVELEMLHTHTMAVALLCLLVLIGINAVSAGCNLALDDKQPAKRRLPKVRLSGSAANENGAKRSRKAA